MAGTEATGGYGSVNVPDFFGFGRGNVGGGTGMIPWQPASIRDPFSFDNRPMTPAQAQAAVANALANPIAPVPFTIQGPRYRNGYHIEDVRIEDQQEQKPENPGRRYVSASTWGRTIPISMGKRRLEGNLLQSSALVPKLEGTTEYYIDYKIPIYADPPEKPGGIITVTYPDSDRPRPSPGSEAGCSSKSACDTRSSPDTPDTPSELSFLFTARDPNPGGPYTVTCSGTFTSGTGIFPTENGSTEVQVVVFLTGTGPWEIDYTITSTNSPPPTVELEASCSPDGGSVSGVGNPHTGTISYDAGGNFVSMD